MTGTVLLIGLDPAVVNYERWPNLTPEKLKNGLTHDLTALEQLGYSTKICFIDHGETAESVIIEELESAQYDCILIGAGVRTDPDEFLLFEKAINLIHAHAPSAKICFNTNPTDTAAAVQRWI